MSLSQSLPGERGSLTDQVRRLCAEGAAFLIDAAGLLSAEARSRVSELGPALLLFAAALGTLILSFLAAGAAFVAALLPVLPLWGAALLVAGLALALAVGFGSLALRRLRRIARAPEHTLSALEEGMLWLRSRSQS